MQPAIPLVIDPELHPAWLKIPGERSGEFLPAFVRISVAIQTFLRKHVPVEYFEDGGRYRDLRTAGPMLVYQASPPFRGRKRAELTYDVLNPALIAMLFRRAKPNLAGLMEKVEARLRGEGFAEVADQYAPRRAPAILNSVQKLSKSRRYLYVLIRSESVLVDALVHLGGLGDLSPKARAKRWASFEKRWNFQLRRLYPGRDFSHLGPVLLTAAQEVLQADPARLADGGIGPAGLTGVPEASELDAAELG